jgi:hypothetical protein
MNNKIIGVENRSINQSLGGIWRISNAYSAAKNFQWQESFSKTGLILNLDSSNTNSYPGTGSNWYDISEGGMGNVNINSRSSDWSFSNDPTTGLKCLYNNSNRTDGNFPGINISLGSGWNKAEGTIELWIKPTSTTGGVGFFNNSDGSDWTNNVNWFWWGTWDTSTTLYFRQGNAATCCNDLTVSSFASTHYTLNTWQNWTLTWKVSTGSAKIYKNGSVITSTTSLPTNISASTNPTPIGQLFNGHERGDNMQFKGYCNVYRMYNRQLSDGEVTANFNAIRSRYGI